MTFTLWDALFVLLCIGLAGVGLSEGQGSRLQNGGRRYIPPHMRSTQDTAPQTGWQGDSNPRQNNTR